MKPQQVFSYGFTTVEIFDGYVRTTLPDGSSIDAHPVPGEEHEARAKALGYPDLWSMCREHDRLHALIAYSLGLSESQALRATVRREESELAGAEEAMVLAAQRFLNLCREAALA